MASSERMHPEIGMLLCELLEHALVPWAKAATLAKSSFGPSACQIWHWQLYDLKRNEHGRGATQHHTLSTGCHHADDPTVHRPDRARCRALLSQMLIRNTECAVACAMSPPFAFSAAGHVETVFAILP
jgi:hypothetical protein